MSGVFHAPGTRIVRLRTGVTLRGSRCGLDPHDAPLLARPGVAVNCERCLAILARRMNPREVRA